jgi:putative PIN family toxin of toxin-antitoxin system
VTPRIVFDTNVLISALIFRGRLGVMVELWREGRILPLLSRETFEEFRDVLDYPKFCLNEEEKEVLVGEVMRFFEVIEIRHAVSGVCADPDDDKFLALAAGAKADMLVTGDRDLLKLKSFRGTRIVAPQEFLAHVP